MPYIKMVHNHKLGRRWIDIACVSYQVLVTNTCMRINQPVTGGRKQTTSGAKNHEFQVWYTKRLHYVYCQTAMQAYRYSGETWLLSQPTCVLLDFNSLARHLPAS